MYSTEKYPSKILQEAVEAIGSLPGVGSRSALRLALHLLGQPAEQIHHFTEAVNRLADDVHYCHICQMIADADTCSICADHTRDARTICVVESVRDVMSIEATGQYRGVYHVLHGVISPLNHIGPDELCIRELLRYFRIRKTGVRTQGRFAGYIGRGKAPRFHFPLEDGTAVTESAGSLRRYTAGDAVTVLYDLMRRIRAERKEARTMKSLRVRSMVPELKTKKIVRWGKKGAKAYAA